MTQNSSNLRPKIALFEPDIPQNTAAIIRTCSCLGAKLEIIEPCGFLISDKRFKRVVMDYIDEKDINFYQSAQMFFNEKKNERIILMTTKASVSYSKFRISAQIASCNNLNQLLVKFFFISRSILFVLNILLK